MTQSLGGKTKARVLNSMTVRGSPQSLTLAVNGLSECPDTAEGQEEWTASEPSGSRRARSQQAGSCRESELQHGHDDPFAVSC